MNKVTIVTIVLFIMEIYNTLLIFKVPIYLYNLLLYRELYG